MEEKEFVIQYFDMLKDWEESVEVLQILFNGLPDDYQNQFITNNKHILNDYEQ